jgi:hypothetical protein
LKLDVRRLAALESALGLRARVDLDARLDVLLDRVGHATSILRRAGHARCRGCAWLAIVSQPYPPPLCGMCQRANERLGTDVAPGMEAFPGECGERPQPVAATGEL